MKFKTKIKLRAHTQQKSLAYGNDVIYVCTYVCYILTFAYFGFRFSTTNM